ncbi:uncharacterized protein PHALS_06060 [Plasmopara halstedii]|uniref:Uncharacterized protein n=1 Tax=Plasmopara halstedii TaxID=4781 RepID=A0A0P1ACE2_PLAHL|nr:uncharacterized protein PHALS_06060 [Plasmopara halstedii]CEG38018.1 hypothetical protein PHALS_06060 [Plasmopara halstedii]|eukprot:XP_024574387.1 hypothetical protein PHALS_06060 [Plasmopara halstedii]
MEEVSHGAQQFLQVVSFRWSNKDGKCVSQFPDFGGKLYDNYDNDEYQHPVVLQEIEEKNRIWYPQALNSLIVNREQQRLLRISRTKSADSSPIGLFSFRVDCMEEVSYGAQHFLQVVSFRYFNEDGEFLSQFPNFGGKPFSKCDNGDYQQLLIWCYVAY